jgi:hypothetical protein
VHDEVVAIDPINQTVTINLINGFSFGRPVWYISMDASIPLSAAIEHNTFAPLMAQLHLGTDDSFSSPIERIFIGTNGPESGGCNNPLRQGFSADLADGHRPNSVLVNPDDRSGLQPGLGLPSCLNGRKTQSRAASAAKSARSSASYLRTGRPDPGPGGGTIWEFRILHQLPNCSASRLNRRFHGNPNTLASSRFA